MIMITDVEPVEQTVQIVSQVEWFSLVMYLLLFAVLTPLLKAAWKFDRNFFMVLCLAAGLPVAAQLPQYALRSQWVNLCVLGAISLPLSIYSVIGLFKRLNELQKGLDE